MERYALQLEMIRSFPHRVLKRLYARDDPASIRPDLLERVRTILGRLDAAETIDDMRIPSYRLHALKGDLKGYRAVTVRANWRIVFRYEDGDAYEVELLDYH